MIWALERSSWFGCAEAIFRVQGALEGQNAVLLHGARGLGTFYAFLAPSVVSKVPQIPLDGQLKKVAVFGLLPPRVSRKPQFFYVLPGPKMEII